MVSRSQTIVGGRSAESLRNDHELVALEFPVPREVGQATVIIGQTGKANAHAHLPLF